MSDVTAAQLLDDLRRLVAFGGDDNTVHRLEARMGRSNGLLVPLAKEQGLAVSPDGHYTGTFGIESELLYVVQTEQGQETLTPAQFADKYGWRNDPDRVRLTGR